MSFDIRLLNGDIVINAKGDVDRVIDSDKLAQDVIKVLNTTLGSDPFNPSYGSILTAGNIGSLSNINIVDIQIRNIIEQSLQKLIQLQAVQQTYQYISDAETIIEFDTPIVERDAIDPRQFNIQVNAISRDLTPITLAFTVIA